MDQIEVTPVVESITVVGGDNSNTIGADIETIQITCDSVSLTASAQVVDQVIAATVETADVTGAEIEVITAEVQGPPGVDGGQHVTYAFSYNSITIVPLKLIGRNLAILRVEMCLTEAFDATSPSLSIGDSANHERLMARSHNDPSQAATFATYPGVSYDEDTQLNLYITPGSAGTRGAGIVSLIWQ